MRGKKALVASQLKCVNIRLDGTVQDSMAGVKVPEDNRAYEILAAVQRGDY
ncbi:BOW99_gp33 family protein [Latilactobacillus fuchuensis]|uniref:BOW99_gp33 family protein n=1 Tax=Latilactobacillus fuchuensis TaxID=164393 RepID=UPI0039B01132